MSLEEELVESSVVIANYREQIEALQKLVRDYDVLLKRIAFYTYRDGRTATELRIRAREEGVNLEEPGTS